jgi:hypothetical protein
VDASSSSPSALADSSETVSEPETAAEIAGAPEFEPATNEEETETPAATKPE